MIGTFWALLPPIIAIVLALITKEVYFSLLIGILTGALFFTGFGIADSLETTFTIMADKVGSNMNIIIFLVLLGMIVALVTKSGASRAYGDWAAKRITSKKGAMLATAGLGILIFVDDYFNCLTVGTVMKPVTNRYNITRAKLAYIIDATAAPICIIAPVSSWAAAVGSSLPEESSIDGFSLFLQTIPFNLYAFLTIFMVFFLICLQFDFSKMRKYEVENLGHEKVMDSNVQEVADSKGKVKDLVIPILCLIFFCICGMLYTGGIMEGVGIVDAFANCNSSLSLVLGAFFTIILIAVMYLPRRIVSFTEFASSLVEGFKAMVPAILILTFAWTLSGICGSDYLDAGGYVADAVGGSSIGMALIPAIFFIVSLGLGFATGTSWGTFGILIPIIVAIFGDTESSMLVISVAACLSGAVCGDHISPISDTTILSSTGAGCNHLDHVSTQIPYALLVAACSFIGYLISGFSGNGWLGLVVAFILLLIALTVVYRKHKKQVTA